MGLKRAAKAVGLLIVWCLGVLLAGCATNPVLSSAVARGDVGAARDLIAQGEKPGAQDLIGAVRKADLSMTRLLLDSGVDVNGVHGGVTALIAAAYGGNLEIVRTLIQRGAKIDALNPHGLTPLIWAAEKGHVSVAQLLIDNGADVNHATQTGFTPLMAAGVGRELAIAEALLDAGARVNDVTHHGFTPLMLAAAGGNPEIVRLLVSKGANIHHRSPKGLTAFALAASAGNAAAAVYLYENGADPSIDDKWVEINGKAHHVLGDYFLSLDNHDQAASSYRRARDSYKRTVESVKGDVAAIRMQEFGLALLGGLVDAGQSYQGRLQSRQLAQISALKYADSTHTGIQGYQAYMTRYNRTYVPTYTTTNLSPLPPLPANATLADKKEFAKLRVKQFEQLHDQMTGVLACFDRQLAGSELHTCVNRVATVDASTR
jgi:hypothetical protein